MIRIETYAEVTFVRLARRLLGRPFYWTGCYYVNGLLLDCGPPATATELLEFLAGRPLDALALTHHHEDHVGAAALLGRRTERPPYIHAEGVGLLRDGFEQQAYRRLAWGGRPPRAAATPLGHELAAGGLHLKVLHTPGHSRDHVCFFEPERGWLFTGDLFLAERLRYLRDDEDLTLLIDSLERVARLPARQVFCAHRGPLHDGMAALRRKADILSAMRAAVRDGLARGRSQREVTRRVVGHEGWMTWFSLGRFSARNFVRAVAAAPGAPHET